jgi:hypothetical protein
LAKELKMPITPEQADEAIKEIDIDGNGVQHFDEKGKKKARV